MVDGLFVQTVSKQCPWKDIEPVVLALSDMYSGYKASLFLEDGGWLDQPAWYTEAMRVYDGEVKEQEAKKMKDQNNAR